MSEQEKCRLEVTIFEARHLQRKGSHYCNLVLNQQSLRTSVVDSGPMGNPKWGELGDGGETLIFLESKLEEIYRAKLEVRIMSRQTSGGADVCEGSVSVPINRIPISTDLDTWFDLDAPATGGSSVSGPPAQLRVGFSLTGELRPEVRKFLDLFGIYTTVVDQGVDKVVETGAAAKPFLVSTKAKAAAVPLGLAALASIPLLIVAAPLLFPIFIIGGIAVFLVALVCMILFASSRMGRAQLGNVLAPMITTLRSSPVGQQLLYNTGPRPSPIAIARAFAPQSRWAKLAASLAVDAIGCSSYVIPVLGELGDVVWAPISALMIDAMYCHSAPYAAYVGFMEELFPFTDIIPTATLAWAKEFLPQIFDAVLHRSGAHAHAS